ncbi:hypothetical protein [Butyricicoccus sp.]|uniref:hypothetical protein n=1 Tax=Butyricicoccus sp. TaxID=2049021 RepID=UPI003AAD0844
MERRDTTIYTYDRDNRMTALIYDGDVQKVSYITDALGQMSRVDDPYETSTLVTATKTVAVLTSEHCVPPTHWGQLSSVW